MSIATRKAGFTVQCPACDADVVVPMSDQEDVPSVAITPAPPALEVAVPPLPTPPSPPETPKAQESQQQEPAQDQFTVPDDWFDDDTESTPPTIAPEFSEDEEQSDSENVESIEFTSYEDIWTKNDPSSEASPLDELLAEESSADEPPPPRPRTEKVPEEFTLPIRKSAIDDEMDLTPMVDVVFQLLIFFMVTASFALHKTIQTPTPDPDQKGATQSIQSLDDLEGVAILVRIDGQNTITIDDEPLAADADVSDALQTKMRTEQKSEIIITADASAWHRTVVKVVDAANSVGMQKIRLATRTGGLE